MMMFSKLKMGLAVLLSTGFVAAGSGMLTAQGPGAGANPPPSKSLVPGPGEKIQVPDPFRPRSAAELAKDRITAAKQRYEVQRAYYEQGRITIDRLADASRSLMQAERDAADAKAARAEAARAHYARLKKILDREKAELEVGRATTADVTEAEQALLDAEYALAKELEAPEAKPADAKAGSSPSPSKPIAAAPLVPKKAEDPTAVPDPFRPRSAAELAKDRITAAKQRYEAQRAYYEQGRITIDRLVDASRGLMQAERDAADAKAARVEAARAHYARLKKILDREKAELKVGRATTADVTEVEQALLDTEFALAKELEAPEAEPAGVEAKAGSRPPSEARTSLDRERLEIARRLYDEARRLYPGEISIVEFLEAAITLAKAEELSAKSKADRVAAIRTQVDRLREIVDAKEKLVKLRVESRSSVDQVRLRLLDAESHLLDASSATPDGPGESVAPAPGGTMTTTRPVAPTALDRMAADRVEIARQLLAEASRLFPGELDTESFLAASRAAMDAELEAATSAAGRRAAIQSQVDRLRKGQQSIDELIKQGIKKPSNGQRVRLGLLESELALAKEDARSSSHSAADLERRLSDLERKLDRLLNLLDAPRLEKR
jgi:outer membrane protein TolC